MENGKSKLTNNLILPYLPEDFENLKKVEEEIRAKSILQINADSALKEHLDMLRTSIGTLYTVINGYIHKNEDELTIQFLGIRLYNASVTSFNLILTGYYQNALILIRDVLETGNLLDYFAQKQSKVSEWRNSAYKDRMKNFSPRIIREELDKRDNFQTSKRGQIYRHLSEYGTHATYNGFQIIAPDGYGKIGCYYNEKGLKALIEELMMRVPHFASVFLSNTRNFSNTFLEVKIEFLTKLKSWGEKYLKVDLSNIDIANLDASVKALKTLVQVKLV